MMSTVHYTKLQVNGPSGHCSHLDFHSPPEVHEYVSKNIFFFVHHKNSRKVVLILLHTSKLMHAYLLQILPIDEFYAFSPLIPTS